MSIGDSFFNYVSDREAPLFIYNFIDTFEPRRSQKSDYSVLVAHANKTTLATYSTLRVCVSPLGGGLYLRKRRNLQHRLYSFRRRIILV